MKMGLIHSGQVRTNKEPMLQWMLTRCTLHTCHNYLKKKQYFTFRFGLVQKISDRERMFSLFKVVQCVSERWIFNTKRGFYLVFLHCSFIPFNPPLHKYATQKRCISGHSCFMSKSRLYISEIKCFENVKLLCNASAIVTDRTKLRA